jgi:D-inositol-3-phosphate glycosyltransferase
VALESLACGTPVVANNVGDLRNIISDGENGFVVTGDSPEIFANKIETILLKAGKNTGIQNQIRSSVKNYHWSVIAQAVARKFQQMLVNYFAAVP